ncbi:UNKNOWN [Stylonychia lemnae]|uniref:EF-hand domain-containing protein n=1 Tax=Stylonychia lemnae TaxID=5949 RepID=A0A078AQV0_STYLE|nr:UNKNOWN [Stylonychia lemnae]|eukprot:CDW84316.1 UNKNOWN [Stylonychia lemnae]
MITLKELRRRQEELFGISFENKDLVDQASIQRATEEINNQLKLAQSSRIQSSKRLLNMKFKVQNKNADEEQIDIEQVFSTQNQLDYIKKLKRIQIAAKEKQIFAEIVEKELDSLDIEEDQKITMKQIEELFSMIGYELSNVQLNEVFLQMDAGRKFNKLRFLKWIRKNYQYLIKKDSIAATLNIPQMARQQIKNQNSRNQESGLQVQSNTNHNNSMSVATLQPKNGRAYFKRNRHTIDLTTPQPKRPVNSKQLEKNLQEWTTKMINLSEDVGYDENFREEDRQDRNLAYKLTKVNNPIYQDPKEREKRQLEEIIKQQLKRKQKKKSQNKTIDLTIDNQKSPLIQDKQPNQINNKTSINQVQVIDKTQIPLALAGVLHGSFYNGSKINFFNKDKLTLERIDENPNALENQKNIMKRTMNMNATQTIMKQVQILTQEEDYVLKPESNHLFNQQKARGTFYDTFNTTFYTQTESIYDEEPIQNNLTNTLAKVRDGKKRQGQDRNKSMTVQQTSNFDEEDRKDYNSLLLDRLKDKKHSFQKLEMKKKEVNQAFDMILGNKRAKSMLRDAFQVVNRDKITQNTSDIRNYQEEVRRRLRDKKYEDERQQEFRVAYISTMLPSALEMHKFIKIMKKDKVFESETGFKIVSQIKTHKEKERIEYLMKYKLSEK